MRYSAAKSFLWLVCMLLAASRVGALGEGVAPWVGSSFEGIPCRGESSGTAFGPWDYNTYGDLPRVEKHHFTPQVEQLAAGMNAAGPATDLDYVLKVIPNHHRALNAVINFHFRDLRNAYDVQKSRGLTGYKLKSPAECYVLRALNYRPNDPITRMLFATLLHRSGKLEDARKQYVRALEDGPNLANVKYNYALLLVDLEEYDRAREIARELYAKDFPLPGLRNKLVRANRWVPE